MRFPDVALLSLPTTFVRFVPGRLHHDGSRYLPVVGLRLNDGRELDVVDRHHRINPDHLNSSGEARLVFLLSAIRLQPLGQMHRCLEHEGIALGAATRWIAQGQIVALPTWEHHRKLDAETVYLEAHLDVGIGRVGVRTTLTTPNLHDLLGADQLMVGDWLIVERSRIDILAFIPHP
jgi:hypothetical protein